MLDHRTTRPGNSTGHRPQAPSNFKVANRRNPGLGTPRHQARKIGPWARPARSGSCQISSKTQTKYVGTKREPSDGLRERIPRRDAPDIACENVVSPPGRKLAALSVALCFRAKVPTRLKVSPRRPGFDRPAPRLPLCRMLEGRVLAVRHRKGAGKDGHRALLDQPCTLLLIRPDLIPASRPPNTAFINFRDYPQPTHAPCWR